MNRGSGGAKGGGYGNGRVQGDALQKRSESKSNPTRLKGRTKGKATESMGHIPVGA